MTSALPGPALASEDACRLYVVRHGETAWNAAGLLQGQLDTALNERGHRQAESAATYFRRHLGGRVAAVYSSDLVRTMDTAAPIAAALGLPVRRDARLRETHFGHWQGLRWKDIESDHAEAHARWRHDPDFAVPGGGESRRSRFRRLCVALHCIALRHPGAHVVVVTHSGMIDDLGRLVHRAPWGAHVRLAKVNAGISICEFRPAAHARERYPALGEGATLELHAAFPSDGAIDSGRAANTLGDWTLLRWGVTDHLVLADGHGAGSATSSAQGAESSGGTPAASVAAASLPSDAGFASSTTLHGSTNHVGAGVHTASDVLPSAPPVGAACATGSGGTSDDADSRSVTASGSSESAQLEAASRESVLRRVPPAVAAIDAAATDDEERAMSGATPLAVPAAGSSSST